MLDQKFTLIHAALVHVSVVLFPLRSSESHVLIASVASLPPWCMRVEAMLFCKT